MHPRGQSAQNRSFGAGRVSSPIERLSTHDICSAIERLAEVERRTEWLLCRHFAELADRFERRAPELCAYVDVYQLARLRFGMGVRRVRERVRMGRALRGLPQIERAFVEGALGYAKVREVTRVAEPNSDALWLAAASELPLRILERRVAEAGSGGEHDTASDPAAVRWASPKSLELRLTLPATTWALLERAMEGARQKSDSSLSDAEALEAVARDALAHQTDGEDRADVRHDGRLRVEGDAEGEVHFYDASGERIEEAAITPGGHLLEAGLSADAGLLLNAMAVRGGWHPDGLCAETGLAAAAVSCALVELELANLVHKQVTGYQVVAPARTSGLSCSSASGFARRAERHLGEAAR